MTPHPHAGCALCEDGLYACPVCCTWCWANASAPESRASYTCADCGKRCLQPGWNPESSYYIPYTRLADDTCAACAGMSIRDVVVHARAHRRRDHRYKKAACQ